MLHTRTAARRRGTVAVLVALLLVAMIGALAIVLDGGILQDYRRRVQGAADAAALAAATELYKSGPAIAASNNTSYDPGGNANTAALASASANGFADDGGATTSVTVNIPPKTGPFKDKITYVEVIITYQQPRLFSSYYGSSTLPVKARAVARGKWGGTGDGVIVLDPSAKDSLNSSGNGSVTVTGGASFIVDSNDSEAAAGTGGGVLTASNFQITGGYTGTLTGTIQTGMPPIPDPLAYLPVPSVPPAGQMTTTNLGNGNKKYVLTPGYYTNLPQLAQGDQMVFEQASYDSNGGIYYIDGGGFKSTGATISMDPATSGGVMIYNNPSGSSSNQAISITGNSSGSVSLSALTSGPYAGILLWQNRTSTVGLSISGQGSFDLEGTFYAANAQLAVSGGGTAIIGSQYISRTLSLSGGGATTINYTDKGTARQRIVMLVE